MSGPLQQQTFPTSAEAIRALAEWAEAARAHHELGALVALVAIGPNGLQVQLASRSTCSSALDMVEDAELLGVLATPDEPHHQRVLWTTQGRDDVRHAPLDELVASLGPAPPSGRAN